MTYMDKYEGAERPVAEKVLLDLAIFHVDMTHERLKSLIALYPHEGIDEKEATEIAYSLDTAERILRMAADITGPHDWPWDTNDFHDFWSLGGNVREVTSMVAYMAQMPDFFRQFMEARSMPEDYGRTLLDGIPKWHN